MESSLSGPDGTLLRKSQAQLKAGRPAEALQLVSAVAASGATVRGLHYLRGLCLSQVGRHDEALQAFQEELAAYPDHELARDHWNALKASLAKPASRGAQAAQRSWHSSLPQATLQDIQKALHHYDYRGVPMLKNPFDLALYSRLLWRVKPRTIFEIGSKSGGSGLWMGDLLNSFGLEAHLYSVDIIRVNAVAHDRVTFLQGDGRALGSTLTQDFLQQLPRPWLVIEDADHAYETSIAVLRFFHPWLRAGEYIVVEDGIISDLQQDPDCNSGPHRALKEFLDEAGKEYEIDGDYCDFFGYNLTWCTNGFLRKLGGNV